MSSFAAIYAGNGYFAFAAASGPSSTAAEGRQKVQTLRPIVHFSLLQHVVALVRLSIAMETNVPYVSGWSLHRQTIPDFGGTS
jgi:hypothetical protein